MFSAFNSRQGRRNNLFGRAKKASGHRRHNLRVWASIARKKNRHRDTGVMRSGDSPPPLQASIPSAYDVPDDAGLNGRVTISSSPAITTSIKPLRSESGDSDAEVISIEEAVPIVHKTLPSPEPQPKIEKKNGYDSMYMDEKKLVDPDDDPCIVKCVYFAQQLCECTIM